jgi:carotenoid cleavage dioxygenase-like enzyme
MTTAEHADFDLELISGQWPAELRGELVIAAPGAKGDFAYGLFSPGHVLRLSLRPGSFGAAPDRFAFRQKQIDSPSVRLYHARPDAFRPVGPGMLSPFGMMNMANTAVMPWKGRLFATWDVGRPIEVDPVSLEFLGEVGSKASWGPSMPVPGVLPFLFSTAHPVIDPERDCLWTVKLAPVAGGLTTHVVRYDGDGPEVKTWPVEGAAFNGTMHTISQTREWLLLIDSGNFKNDPGELAGRPRTVLMDLESPAFLVRKADLEKTPPGTAVPMKRFMIAPPTGHFYAKYDDTDGIQVIFEHMDGVDLGFFLKPDDVDVYGDPIDPTQVGVYNMGMTPSSLSEIEFDPESGRVRQSERIRSEQTFNNQLSAMDWSLEGLSRPTRHHMMFSGYRPYNVSQRALDAYRDRFDRRELPAEESPCHLVSVERGSCKPLSSYLYPTVEDWAGSPIFVPREPGRGGDELTGRDPGGHDGYVVVPVLSDAGFRVDCFDAADVSRGPIAQLRGQRNERIGLILHSCWLPEARPAPDVERLRFAEDFSPADLAGLSPVEAETLERVARELDEGLPMT